MLNDSQNNCSICKRRAKYKCDGEYYCKEHYLTEAFECKDVHTFLKKKNISHQHHALDHNLIITKKDSRLIELCMVLGLTLDEDYWFGKGKIGITDLSNTMFIQSDKEAEDYEC